MSVVTGLALPEELREEWAALAERAGASPFCHPGWVRRWSETIGAPVRVGYARRNGDLCAAYPVVLRLASVRSAADWHVPLLDPVGDEAAVAAVAGEMARVRNRVALRSLSSWAADGFESALSLSGFRVRRRVLLESPLIELRGGWDRYWESISAKRRREARRRRRRLEEMGRVSFTHHTENGGLEHLLAEGFAVEGSGWKGGTAVGSDPGLTRFYSSVASWAARRGMLRLHFLRLGGRAAAFDLALEWGGAEWLLKTGYDAELSRYAPGFLLRAEVIERAFRSGLKRYEFLGGDDPWKMEWTGSTRSTEAVDGYGGRLSALAMLGARAKRRARVWKARLGARG